MYSGSFVAGRRRLDEGGSNYYNEYQVNTQTALQCVCDASRHFVVDPSVPDNLPPPHHVICSCAPGYRDGGPGACECNAAAGFVTDVENIASTHTIWVLDGINFVKIRKDWPWGKS